MMDLIIKVHEIRGKCPVYNKGDKIVIREGFRIDLNKTNALCLHSLASILPYYVALSRGISPKKLGLNRGESEGAFIQCLDPCEYTGGGTVIFEIIQQFSQ